MSEDPFFIVGFPRSGTTLLRFMLASHPRLWIPDETGFLPFLRVPPDRALTRTELDAVCRRIGRLHREWAAAANGLHDRLDAGGEYRLGDLLDRLYRERMAASGASRWGDKTPGYVWHLPALAAIFPRGRFLHLIRDGRDVTLSALERWRPRFWKRPYMDAQYLLRSWVRAVSGGRAAGAVLGPERYFELRYEELVRHPEACLARVAAWLGERLHPGMLEHHLLARDVVGAANRPLVREPVSARRVGRWRDAMSPFALWTAERLAGPLLEELGYERTSPAPPFPLAPLRLALGAVRYAAVRAVQATLDAAGFARLNRGKRRPA